MNTYMIPNVIPTVEFTRVYHVRCPRCAALGKDRSEDNLAVYPDKHRHCFSCGYHEDAPIEARLVEPKQELLSSESTGLDFPEDYFPLLDYPVVPMEVHAPINWLKAKYGIYDSEIRFHGFGWSSNRKMLVCPIKDANNNLLAWQGRYFTPSKPMFDEKGHPKYFTKGPVSDILHFTGREDSLVIVTEDIVSAIKVGRVTQTMPLWGSSMPLKTIRRLSERFKHLGIWLDSDKSVEAVKTAIRASLYIPTFVINTPEDPKAYNMDAIEEYIDLESRNIIKDEEPIAK